jgi:hypothetical protein
MDKNGWEDAMAAGRSGGGKSIIGTVGNLKDLNRELRSLPKNTDDMPLGKPEFLKGMVPGVIAAMKRGYGYPKLAELISVKLGREIRPGELKKAVESHLKKARTAPETSGQSKALKSREERKRDEAKTARKTVEAPWTRDVETRLVSQFNDKDKIKNAGGNAAYSPDMRSWIVPAGSDLAPYRQWWPQEAEDEFAAFAAGDGTPGRR